MQDIKEWRPTKRQEDFITIPDTIFEALYGGAAGGGKDLDASTSILTPNGFLPLNDIHPGDCVISPQGNAVKVLAETPLHSDEAYLITFDNAEVIAGANHLWLTFDIKQREQLHKLSNEFREKRRITRASRGVGKRLDLAARNARRKYTYTQPPMGSIVDTATLYAAHKVQNRSNYSVTTCQPVNLPTQALLIDPYVLGVWLGDGNSRYGWITCFDTEILDQIRSRGYVITSHTQTGNYGILGLMSKLAALDVLENKHVPNEYLWASFEQRLALLQGLMDTDGYCAEDGQCEFVNTNEALADAVFSLAASVGLKPFARRKIPLLNGRPCTLAHCVTWSDNKPVFLLSRKRARLKSTQRSTQTQHYITNVEYLGVVENLKCIQVEDSYYTCTKSLIPTHNSESLLMLPVVREFYKYSDFKGLILRRTYPELEREIIIRSRDYYPATGGVYNESKKRWHWPAFNSYLQFGYAEHEKDVRNYDTAEYNYVAFDELTSFTEFQYKYIAFSRCRSKADSGLPAIVRNGTNPGNVGHGFVRARFVEPSPPGYTIIREKFGGQYISRIYIPAKATDNPHVDQTYVARLAMLPVAERLAKLDGDWWTFSGQVFDDWRIQPYMDEPANAQHVIKPFAIPDWWPRVLAIDWGFAAMMWAGWAAISPDHRIYLYREHTCTKTKVSTWASDLKKITAQDCPNGLTDCVLDPSAWQRRGDAFTIAEQVKDYSELSPRQADNDRLGGKILMQEALRWRPRPITKLLPGEEFDMEQAEWLRRNKGTASYEVYVNRFVPETLETNIPRLQVFDTCTEFIRVIPLCVYNDQTALGVNKEDVADFNGDDPYDGGRYLLKACMRLLGSADQAATQREEVAAICGKAESAKDLTAFYMRMSNLEAKRRMQSSSRRRPRRYGRHHVGHR